MDAWFGEYFTTFFGVFLPPKSELASPRPPFFLARYQVLLRSCVSPALYSGHQAYPRTLQGSLNDQSVSPYRESPKSNPQMQ